MVKYILHSELFRIWPNESYTTIETWDYGLYWPNESYTTIETMTYKSYDDNI